MPLHRWSPLGLTKMLKGFLNPIRYVESGEGVEIFTDKQCQLETTDDIYRGKMRSVFIPSPKKRVVVIRLEWLCKRRIVSDGVETPEEKWEVQTHSQVASQFFEMDYSWYYHQRDEERIKLKGRNEIMRLFSYTDHTNLVEVEGEFIPNWKIHEKSLKAAVIAVLLKPKVKK